MPFVPLRFEAAVQDIQGGNNTCGNSESGDSLKPQNVSEPFCWARRGASSGTGSVSEHDTSLNPWYFMGRKLSLREHRVIFSL